MRLVWLVTLGIALAVALCAQSKPGEQYRLGAGDEVLVRVFNLEEFSSGAAGDTSSPFPAFRVDEGGKLTLPVVGTVNAQGLTVDELSSLIIEKCKKYLRDPQVSVLIKTFKSRPVSVFGAVKTPGVFQIEGGKSIIEVLSLAGGLTEDAGSIVRITRRISQGPIPLPAAETQGEFSVATLRLSDISAGGSAVGVVALKPFDVITVPNSPMVYVLGSLKKPGGFMLKSHNSISVLEAVAAAEGLDRDAAPKKARLLRPVPDSDSKTTIALDVKAILQGKSPDMTLQPGDVLYVPTQANWKSTLGKMSLWVGGSMASAMVYRY